MMEKEFPSSCPCLDSFKSLHPLCLLDPRHKKYKVFVPELVFGHLLTSDNYDDSERRSAGSGSDRRVFQRS